MAHSSSVIIKNTLDMITKSCDDGKFEDYKDMILPQIDLIDHSFQAMHSASLYDLIEGCSISEISSYISSSDIDSINNCIGQIEAQAITM
jgi:hypothetical protein